MGWTKDLRLMQAVSANFAKYRVELMTPEEREQALASAECVSRRTKRLRERLRKVDREQEAAREGEGVTRQDISARVVQMVRDAGRVAAEELADEPWLVKVTLRGVDGLQYVARHIADDVQVHVYAHSLEGLLRGIEAVEPLADGEAAVRGGA